jgi:hypothetical protein
MSLPAPATRVGVAAAVVREGAEVIGSSVGFAVDLLDPQLIVIGDGRGLAAGLYRDTLERAMRRSIWSDTNRGLPILDAELGTDAAWVRAVGAKLSSGAMERDQQALAGSGPFVRRSASPAAIVASGRSPMTEQRPDRSW